MQKIPYGISNFSKISRDSYYYVDRTPYIKLLEDWGETTLLFIRPRRFGKSLFISMLRYYYGLEHKNDFENIFGKYYIGEEPTPLANQYLVLTLDFSGIDTSNTDKTKQDFLHIVQEAALNFMEVYSAYFNEKDIQEIKNHTASNNLIRSLINKVGRNAPNKKIYLLIDEYDHFTNELLAFNFSSFKTIVSRNGWVRKFYEILKTATTQGIIDRMFITGISPITLDNLTTGFNISSNVSTEALLNEMMGFTEKEVRQLLKDIHVPEGKLDDVLEDLRFWYNGYLFHLGGKEKVYNPDMVLYFVKHYARYGKYPDDLMDENIASDYGKMRRMFKINDTRQENTEILKAIIEEGEVKATLTTRYSFERTWTSDDFVSLLFYMGILSIKKAGLDRPVFSIPNYVIRQLYFQYFNQITLEAAQLSPQQLNLKDKIEDLAQHDDIQPVIELTQNVISQLGREDFAHFNETSLKAIFTSFFYQVRFFNIHSELEVKKKKGKGRVDLLLARRPPFQPTYQFVFELKYLKEKQLGTFEKVKTTAVKQLQEYVQQDDMLKSLDHLKAYVLIFTMKEGVAIPV